MNAITHRYTAVFGSLLLLAAAALTGCATTGGATTANGTARSSMRQAFAGDAAMHAGAAICTGGHASRFPNQEQIGRVCRPSAALGDVFWRQEAHGQIAFIR